MKQQREKNGFSFYLQILILLAVFLAVSMVLVQVFGAARAMSRRARDVTAGTSLCRSAAEAFAAGGTAEGTAALLGGTAEDGTVLCRYDADQNTLGPDESGGVYFVTVTVTQKTEKAGTMAAAQIEARTADGTLAASLDTEVYLPGAEGGAAHAA